MSGDWRTIHESLPLEIVHGGYRAIAKCACGRRFSAMGYTASGASSKATGLLFAHQDVERRKVEEAGDG